jgi:LSD1 subclass zinc finger protein
MSVAITCASCRRPLRVPESLLGKTVRCPLCTDTFTAEPDPAPPPPAVQAPGSAEAPGVATACRETRPPWTAAGVGPDEVLDALLVRPARAAPPAVSGRDPEKPLTFTAKVKKDPYRAFSGSVRAEVTARGLRLAGGPRAQAFVPVGTPVRYLGGNRLAVPLDDREVEIAVANRTVYRQRLARDVAAFLSGDRELPRPADYRWPWYAYLLWLAPAGLPFLAGSLDAAGEEGGLIFLWGLLAVFLTFTTYVVIQREKWARRLRLPLAAGLSVAAYAAVVWVGAANSESQVRPSDWQYVRSPGGGVRMPGHWHFQTRYRDGRPVTVYVAELKRRQAAFTFGYVDLPGRPQNPTGDQLKAIFEEGIQSLQRDVRGVTRVSEQPLSLKHGECPGREYAFRVWDPGRAIQGKIVARMYFHQGRLYTLAAAGKNVEQWSPEVRTFFDSLSLP